MIQLYDLTQSEQWDAIVRSFADWDVYYLSGYAKAFQIHGDGDPYLLYYQDNGLRGIYVYMRRETALLGVYDSVTPYGYGGVLFEGDCSEQNRKVFWDAYVAKMKEENIVDNFVRYHPLLKNAEYMKDVSDVIDLGHTIAMDLTSQDIIWNNIVSKNRNMIRKAERNGVEILHGQGMELMDQFIELYNSTMRKKNADEYYFFKRPFYESIDRDLKKHYEIFYAMYEGRSIAMSIMIFANGKLSYHFSGSDMEYKNLAPSNLLLYKAALWGCENGYRSFHLGGGVGSGEDSLFKFKAAFNKNSVHQFSIGKQVFDREKYDELVKIRKESDPDFDNTSSYFPLYRS